MKTVMIYFVFTIPSLDIGVFVESNVFKRINVYVTED
jgi:hypothetical protein